MKARTLFVLVTCVIAIAVGDAYGQANASPGFCYVTTGGSSGSLYWIDLSTAQVSLIGATGLDGLPGLTIDSQGHMFANERGTANLYRLDAATGASSFVSNVHDSFDYLEMSGLAFDSNDVLYGVSPYSDFGTVDTVSGAFSLIDVTSSVYGGLAFDPTGVLYASATNAIVHPIPIVGIDSIGTIDPDGTEHLVGDMEYDNRGTPDLAFDSSGRLYAVKGGGKTENRLVEISPIDAHVINDVGPINEGSTNIIASGFDCFNSEPEPPAEGKVTICHIPPGNPSKAKTKEIDAGSLDDHLGHGDYEGPCSAGKTSVADLAVPESIELSQNYPNPFNPSTTISFALPEAASVHLAVYNAVGQEVKVLVSSTLEAGLHSATWDATDHNGQHVATGVYLYRLTAGNYVETRKMLLLE